MPEVKLPEAGITFDSILYVIALIVAVSGVLVALVKGWEAYRKISVRDKVKAVDERCAALESHWAIGREFREQNCLDILRPESLFIFQLISGFWRTR